MTIAEQIGRVNSRIEASRCATEFCQYAVTLLRTKGNLRQAVEFADAAQLPVRVRQSLKAAVAGGTISDLDALAPFRTLSEGFSSTLTAASSFDAILAGGAHIAPLHSQFGVRAQSARWDFKKRGRDFSGGIDRGHNAHCINRRHCRGGAA